MEDNDDENYDDYDDDLGRPFGVEMGNSQDSKLPALCNYIKNDEFILPALCDNIIKKSENADASELPHNENEVVIRTNRWFSGKRTVGLKGGASNDLEPSNPRLKLINNRGSEGTTNICFVNASIQLFRMTGYAQFLLTHMEPLLVGQVDTVNYKCCRALLSLYTESSNRGRSAANVRRLVSAWSLKRHLNNGSQQDASEFLDSLVNVVISECSAIEAFVAVQSSHWGNVQIRKVFLDNPPDGACKKCGKFPSLMADKFQSLKLTVPHSNLPVALESLIFEYFSESTENLNMKCSNCCPHEKEKVQCTQAGFCCRPAATRSHLILSPKFLFLHLLRFGNALEKVNTVVELNEELELPNGVIYEVIGALVHQGTGIACGHYLTFMKDSNGHWLKFDDTHINETKLEDIKDSYIILLKKKVADIVEPMHVL